MLDYSLNDVRTQFDSGTYARGQAYAREGKVRRYAWNGLTCESEVAGSGNSVYHQRIRLDPHGRGIDIAGSCSCPMDYNCKHVVAVLLDSHKRGHESLPSGDAATPAVARPSASHATMHWLMQLAQAREASIAAHQPARAREGIVWVLLPRVRGELQLYLCKARFKADGTIASATALSSLYNLFQQAADVIAPGDELAIRMYLGMRFGGGSDIGTRPSGTIGYELLTRLQAERRLWWASSRSDIKPGKMERVTAGDELNAFFAYMPNHDDTAFSVQLLFEASSDPQYTIATDPPLYLNRGELGAIVLPGAAAAIPFETLAELMARAPVIPAQEAADAECRIFADGLEDIIDPPEVMLQEASLQDIDDWYADVAEAADSSPWFDLELGIVVNGVKHPLLPLLVQLIRNAPRDFEPAVLVGHLDTDTLPAELDDGARVALPWGRVKPILATLGELYFTERTGKAIRLPTLDSARLAELEASAQLRWLGGERLRDVGARLHRFDGIAPVAAPAGLQAQLRDYQSAGLAWMQFLRAYGFGGILADDMGLGKTIQTLAHILVEKEAGRLDAPALVVAPTSLMDNWQSEAARFAPGLRVLCLHGKDRAAQFGQIVDADLVLTTYALLPRDEATLRGQRFHLLILDESQYIKNHRAKAAQTARLIDARHRLCLTGTPLQNHLGELWSQFHFLMPGLLGDDKTFNAQFRKPIEKGGDQQRAALLTKRVKPFMLRRTKDAVAKELPPKTEVHLPVEFGSAQRDLYETVRVAMDKKVRDEIATRGVARSQIVILDALLKLRQVCCDPRLLKATTASAATVKSAGSAKFDALFELLDTLLSEGRRVLVFSQFTSMLALIGAALDEQGRRYALLTGDTLDRAAPVAAFQQGAVSLFLISLKAGGVGLNLTAADTVIHFDPWWNPASEDQATDRARRIGQAKPVFVYKLIVRGSVEEKIQELQRKKSSLADALLGEGGTLGQQVTADDLKAIFS